MRNARNTIPVPLFTLRNILFLIPIVLLLWIASVSTKQNAQLLRSVWTFGSGYIIPSGIEVDSIGNIYIIGDYTGGDLNPGNEESVNPVTGGIDTFLMKLDSKGDLVWSRSWGSGSVCYIYDVIVSGENSIYVAGEFQHSVDFDPGSGLEEHSVPRGNRSSLFLSKFDSYGEFQWVHTWTSSLATVELDSSVISRIVCNLAMDDNENIFLIGTGPLLKFNPSGECNVYPEIVGEAIAIDENNNLYIAGNISNSQDSGSPSQITQHSSDSKSTIFLKKFSPDCQLMWTRTWNELIGAKVNDLSICSVGKVFVLGRFNGSNYPQSSASTTSSNIFLRVFNDEGDNLWDRKWRVAWIMGYVDRGEIASDVLGNVYITSPFSGPIDFDPDNSGNVILSNSFSADFYLMKLDADGEFQWVRTWGGDKDDFTTGITLDMFNNIYLIGHFTGVVDFDPSLGSLEFSSVDGPAFLIKLKPDGSL